LGLILIFKCDLEGRVLPPPFYIAGLSKNPVKIPAATALPITPQRQVPWRALKDDGLTLFLSLKNKFITLNGNRKDYYLIRAFHIVL
jgi:hypothetical protein